MLQHGHGAGVDGAELVARVVAQVRGNIAMLAQQKYSSNVVEVRACV